MLADLDLLLIAVFCAADDLLPSGPTMAVEVAGEVALEAAVGLAAWSCLLGRRRSR